MVTICSRWWNMMTYMFWMNSFVYAAETAYNKKTQKCLTRHPTGFTKHNAIQEKSDFSMNSIHNNTYHEMIWWPLQSKWSTCQCSSNTRSNYRKLPNMPSDLQLHPIKLKGKLEYKSH